MILPKVILESQDTLIQRVPKMNFLVFLLGGIWKEVRVVVVVFLLLSSCCCHLVVVILLLLLLLSSLLMHVQNLFCRKHLSFFPAPKSSLSQNSLRSLKQALTNSGSSLASSFRRNSSTFICCRQSADILETRGKHRDLEIRQIHIPCIFHSPGPRAWE